MPTRRTLITSLTAAAGVSALGGCSWFDGDQRAAAQRVADAYAKHDLSGLRFTSGTAEAAQTEFDARIGNLSENLSTIVLGDVNTDGDNATVPFTWKWTIPGGSWSTEGTLTLRKVDDTWRPVWQPTALDDRLTGERRLLLTTTQARRANILGAGDVPIVEERPVTTYGVDKSKVNLVGAVAAANRVAAMFDLDAAALVKAVRAAGPKQFVPAITLRDNDPLTPSDASFANIAGTTTLKNSRPLALTRSFASAVLGNVGDPDAERVQAEKDAGSLLLSGDQVGTSGLQQRYDKQLIGTPGINLSLVDGSGKIVEELRKTQPVQGKPLRTTLDPTAQRLADRIMSATGSVSGLVAIRPSTGAILAATSGPASNSYGTATIGRYPPGSTFKIVSSLAFLRSGITPDSMVDCPSTVTVDGRVFSNYSDYPASALGRQTFRTAIANSCNTAVISLRDRAEGTALHEAAAALGIGVDGDIGFPAYFGQVPDPASQTEAAADLIGQGKVQASVLAMATVVASVVKGATVTPTLLPDVEAKVTAPKVPLTRAEAAGLRDLMRAVVTEGSGTLLGDVPGAPVIAKTGTAEFGTNNPPDTHAWMVAGHGDLAVAVFVEQGQSGSTTAGPLLKEFLLGFA